MKKSTIWFLTIIMALTFAGLIYVQFVYMNNMVRMRDDQFDESVRRSLYAVSSLLEQEETRHFLEENMAQVDDYKPYKKNRSTEGVELKFTTQSGLSGNLTLEGTPDQLNARPASPAPPAAGRFSDRNTGQSLRENLRGRYLYQKGLVDEVILNIISRSSNRPIWERADSTMVRNFMRSELDNNGLRIPFEFAVTNRRGSVIYHTAGYPDLTAKQTRPASDFYEQPLFPNDPINKINYLNVYFPSKQDYIFQSIRFMLPSFAFTLILLLIFIYAIMVAFRQKKVNEMKNDFINNMTHEFKTPISSISLASQMLADDSVRKSEAMMRHITEVIDQDTKRLRFLVEKVLQMSLYYDRKSALNLAYVNANEAIEGITHTFKLKVEKYGGKITTNLSARESTVHVDRMHFTNVIYNLLDNAVKYRDENRPLNLTIATSLIPGNPHRLRIDVTDTGMGIRRDDLRKIFDKFYRVNTGDRHDVKGFGLGLAYVKKMIHEFNGEITAESELGTGTTFTIVLPLATPPTDN